MIKLEITIKENEVIKLEDTVAIDTEVRIIEKGKNATKGEKEVSNIIKKRLNVNQKYQVENCTNKKSDKEILQELLDKLNS